MKHATWSTRRPRALGLVMALLWIGATATGVYAQDLKGAPPSPEDEKPKPLPVKEDLTPSIPPEFDRARPNYHVVNAGDTLFQISQAYFGTPYVWPVVWSFNDHITNPHWIYPGDIVYLRPPLPGTAPFDQNAPSQFPGQPAGLSLAMGGFMMETDDKEDDERAREVRDGSVGRLMYSPEAKDMLAFPDRVYISLIDDEKNKARDGKVYAVLRYIKELEDPNDDDRVVARKYKVIGAVRIVESHEKAFDTAVVVQSWEEMYRGDRLFPYERQLLKVAPAVATETVIGNIIDTLNVETLFGEHHYIFINRGSKDGVRVGNRFFAYERREGRSELDEDEIKELPFERVAQVMVIHTDRDYSTALVTESRRELKMGTRLEMYEGY